MKARILGTLAGAAALLLMGAVLPPVASAQSVDCTTVTVPTNRPDQRQARLDLLSTRINPQVLVDSGGNQDVIDAEIYQMLCRAANWEHDGPARGGDLNPTYVIPQGGGPAELQTLIDSRDALLMYFAYLQTDFLTSSRDTRDSLLSGVRGSDQNGSFVVQTVEELDNEYQKLVVRALRLRCNTSDYTHDWCGEGAPVDPNAPYGQAN